MMATKDKPAVSRLTKELRDGVAGQREEDAQFQLMVQSMRGTNLNTDEKAREGLEMQLVDVQGGGDDELPLKYDYELLRAYFQKRPGAVAKRLFQIGRLGSAFMLKIGIDIMMNRTSDPAIQAERAGEARDVMTALGPFFVKLGQALSIRPDILPPESMIELQKLCDKVPSYDSKIAMQTIVNELGKTPDELFSEITPEPLAAASLGQVYRAKLRTTGEIVAVKVQRPFVLETVSLDLYLLRSLGVLVNRMPDYDKTDIVALVDEFAGNFYAELDYRLECENGIRIAEHMAELPFLKIPKCYPDYTSRRVHTAEWIDGVKLAQSDQDDVQKLVNVGVVAYLTQLLGAGFFHADPHPGNMIRTPEGQLAIIDFGLMTQLTDEQKTSMIESIVHLINRDYREIGNDFKKLDFIAADVDVAPIEPALKRVFDSALEGGGAKSINFNDLAADLAQITFDYPFRLPPYFALVIRAIGVLEGIALVGDPDFAIIDEAFPYISQRLLTDDNPRLRAALRNLIYGYEDNFDAERLIDLLSAFEKFDNVKGMAGGSSYAASGAASGGGTPGDAENLRVSAALSFFFSPDGKFLRELLLEETTRGVDVLSRDALQRLREEVPAFKLITSLAPRGVKMLAPRLTPEEETMMRNTVSLLEFFLGPSMPVQLGTGQSVSESMRTVQRFRPILRQFAAPMNEFGLKVMGRLANLYAIRGLQSLADELRTGYMLVPRNNAQTG